jgi:plastocyanin
MRWGSWINDLPERPQGRAGREPLDHFDTLGTCHYICTLHSKAMDGEVIIK